MAPPPARRNCPFQGKGDGPAGPRAGAGQRARRRLGQHVLDDTTTQSATPLDSGPPSGPPGTSHSTPLGVAGMRASTAHGTLAEGRRRRDREVGNQWAGGWRAYPTGTGSRSPSPGDRGAAWAGGLGRGDPEPHRLRLRGELQRARRVALRTGLRRVRRVHRRGRQFHRPRAGPRPSGTGDTDEFCGLRLSTSLKAREARQPP